MRPVLPQKTGQRISWRSRGGFSCKLHFAVDAQSLPWVAPGTWLEHDMSRAEELLAEHAPAAVIADKGYDCEAFADTIRERGAQVVILLSRKQAKARNYGKLRYKTRNLAETLCQSIQTLPTHRHTLREDCSQLFVVRSSRCSPRDAKGTVNVT